MLVCGPYVTSTNAELAGDATDADEKEKRST